MKTFVTHGKKPTFFRTYQLFEYKCDGSVILLAHESTGYPKGTIHCTVIHSTNPSFPVGYTSVWTLSEEVGVTPFYGKVELVENES